MSNRREDLRRFPTQALAICLGHATFFRALDFLFVRSFIFSARAPHRNPCSAPRDKRALWWTCTTSLLPLSRLISVSLARAKTCLEIWLLIRSFFFFSWHIFPDSIDTGYLNSGSEFNERNNRVTNFRRGTKKRKYLSHCSDVQWTSFYFILSEKNATTILIRKGK